ncbi:MAG: hypothetical protein ACXV98_07765 [Ilumatobacteraceae bacterium]
MTTPVCRWARGRVLALQAIVFLGSTPIGGPILGWVCQHFGARIGVVFGGASAIVAGFYGMRAVRVREAGVPGGRGATVSGTVTV